MSSLSLCTPTGLGLVVLIAAAVFFFVLVCACGFLLWERSDSPWWFQRIEKVLISGYCGILGLLFLVLLWTAAHGLGWINYCPDLFDRSPIEGERGVW